MLTAGSSRTLTTVIGAAMPPAFEIRFQQDGVPARGDHRLQLYLPAEYFRGVVLAAEERASEEAAMAERRAAERAAALARFERAERRRARRDNPGPHQHHDEST